MRFVTLSALVLALGSVSALAQDAAAPTRPTFDFAAADADASGGISRDEWRAYVGGLMESHRATRIGDQAGRLIEAGDANGDGMLDRAELEAGIAALADARRAAMAERFAARSEGRDDRGAERPMRRDDRGERYERGERHERGERGERQERGYGRGHHGMHDRAMGGYGGHHGMRGAMMGEGAGAMADRAFDRIDTDRDGTISADELAAAQARWAERAARRAERMGPAND